MDLRRSKSVPAPPIHRHQPEALHGKYEPGRLLGRGIFAKVYYARSLADGKQASPSRSSTSPKSSAPSWRPLSHPNILKLHDVIATKSKIYLVMEHAAGGDLSRRPPPAATSCSSIAALRYCHARGVAHRDVKPQNLLVDRDGNLKAGSTTSASPRFPTGSVTTAGSTRPTAPDLQGAGGRPPGGIRRRRGRRVVVRHHPLRPPRRPAAVRRRQPRPHVQNDPRAGVRVPAMDHRAGAAGGGQLLADPLVHHIGGTAMNASIRPQMIPPHCLPP